MPVSEWTWEGDNIMEGNDYSDLYQQRIGSHAVAVRVWRPATDGSDEKWEAAFIEVNTSLRLLSTALQIP